MRVVGIRWERVIQITFNMMPDLDLLTNMMFRLGIIKNYLNIIPAFCILLQYRRIYIGIFS